MGDRREVQLHGRRMGLHLTIQGEIDRIDDSVTILEADGPNDWTQKIGSAVTALENGLQPIVSDLGGTEGADLMETRGNIDTALRNGEDPDGGGTTTQAVQDFRDFVGGGTYSGDAQADDLADLLKAVIDRGSAPA